ncbi:MAG: GNAT family N-acetyltransferase [Lachnospiraceae bacterium]|nr:GNAT family N-acetyltransferase [Lachnospiraceae bacterium]
MAFRVQLASYDDLKECARVETEAMGTYCYLEDAWHYFYNQKGGLVTVYNEDDKMIGIGRFSVLFDGSGWLETLRISPEWQKQGAGKMIYEVYHQLAKEYGCQSMAMFTGVNNKVSAGLAAINGLSKAAQHRGYHLTDLSGGDVHGFKHVNWKRAAELIVPMKDEYNDYMIFNRTFYHVNEENAKGFAIEGKVFEDVESGSFIVCGARFQHQVTLHIAMMGGDYEKCLDFAVNYAKAQGLSKVSCTFAIENEKLEEALKARGFVAETSDLITMEIVF